MAHVQYKTTVPWDGAMKDVGFLDDSLSELAISAVKITTGAPAATAGCWAPGAIINNIISGVVYQNTGSTASPVWAAMAAGAGVTSLTGDVTGSGPGATATTIAAGAVTGAKMAALTSGNILVGSAGNVATSVAMSGDATIIASGLLTVALRKGTVTQATSITTGVTLNQKAGVITTVSSTLAAGASATFTVTDSFATTSSVIQLTCDAGSSTGTPYAMITNRTAGTFDIVLRNVHASDAFNNTIAIHFAIVA